MAKPLVVQFYYDQALYLGTVIKHDGVKVEVKREHKVAVRVPLEDVRFLVPEDQARLEESRVDRLDPIKRARRKGPCQS